MMGNSLVIVGNIGEHLRNLALLPEMHLLRDFSWLQASPCWCPSEEMTADVFQKSRNDAESTCSKALSVSINCAFWTIWLSSCYPCVGRNIEMSVATWGGGIVLFVIASLVSCFVAVGHHGLGKGTIQAQWCSMPSQAQKQMDVIFRQTLLYIGFLLWQNGRNPHLDCVDGWWAEAWTAWVCLSSPNGRTFLSLPAGGYNFPKRFGFYQLYLTYLPKILCSLTAETQSWQPCDDLRSQSQRSLALPAYQDASNRKSRL